MQRSSSKQGESAPISWQARLLGSAATAAFLEPFFQPIDTSVKRLQTNKELFCTPSATFAKKMDIASQAIFQDAYGKPLTEKIKSLYKGMSVAIAYSIMQRSYKFCTQSTVSDNIEKHVGETTRSHFDAPTAKVLQEMAAGVITGTGELVLLPADNLKVKRQTGVLQKGVKPLVDMIIKERGALYNGWEAALCRNIPGTVTMFGGAAYVYNHWFHVQGSRDATVSQSLIASAAGAFCSVVATNPADVIKVRTQKLEGQGKVSAFSVLKNTVKEEGVKALGKGLKLRAVVAVPKLTAVQVVANYLTVQAHTFFSRKAEIAAVCDSDVKEKCAPKK